MNCATCKFWEGDPSKADGWGACHRRAPSPWPEPIIALAYSLTAAESVRLGLDEQALGATENPASGWVTWPAVHAADFCGEFVVHPKKAPTFA